MFKFEDSPLFGCDSSSGKGREDSGVLTSAKMVLATIMPLEIHTKVTTEGPCIVGRLLNPFTTRVRVDSSVDH